MRRAIYIGKGHRREFWKVYITGVGWTCSSELSYGMTGRAWEDDDMWDFRPDGLNVSHRIPRKDIYFPKQ